MLDIDLSERLPVATPASIAGPCFPPLRPPKHSPAQPAATMRSHNAFVEEATNLRIGVWDSTPYRRHARAHKLHELMHLIEGSVTLQSADGTDLAVHTDGSVFVPQGAKSTAYVRKFYAVK